MNIHLAGGRVPQWYRDSCSCLQTIVASLGIERGWDPLDLLGSGLNFLPEEGPIHAEYYAPQGDSLNYLQYICAMEGVEGRWIDGLRSSDLRAAVQGRPVVLPVDNYYLPFRPAYRDVHAAHLILVERVRQSESSVEYYVSDAQPPAFQGWLSEDVVLAAWTSSNPDDVQDRFFSGNSGAGRILQVSIPQYEEIPSKALLASLQLGANRLVEGNCLGSVAHGRRVLDSIIGRGNGSIYVLGWWHQAQADLHSQWLVRFEERGELDVTRLRTLAARVANAWSPVRVAAAREPNSSLALRKGVAALCAAYEAYAFEALTVLEGPYD